MNTRTRRSLAGLTTVLAVAGGLVAAGPAGAIGGPAAPGTVYVGPGARPGAAGPAARTAPRSSCQHPDFTAIQPAIEAVALKGTVVVCAGTYPGMVDVDRQITLAGRPGAKIDATGDVYGIGVSASWSTVTGLTVSGASPYDPDNNQIADGIVTAAFGPDGPVAADHVKILKNVVTGNLGSGIDLNSSSYSIASFNVADGNGVGINVADDLGLPADHDTVTFNQTNGNFGGCGIALADHSGAGVSGTLVGYNISDDNGLATATAPDASAGSGVILASPIPGGIVTDNTIVANEFHGNGHGGVVVHAHAPGSDFSGNAVIYNRIGTNNVRTDENDLKSTGVYLGSNTALSIQVNGNVIGPDYYGIFTSGPVTVTGPGNTDIGVIVKIGTAPSF